tara:strand:+ start:3451 stop:4041 length:591 start_codon:yes stop_codon:yes gene_type:complete
MTTITKTLPTVNNLLTVSAERLGMILANITKSTTISLTYFVDESKSRVIGGEKQVQKRVKINNLRLNHDYGNKVNNLNGTTDFVAQPLNGKKRLTSTLLSSLSKKNYGRVMLDGKILKTESRHLLGYFHYGKEIQLSKSDSTFGRTDLVAPSFYVKSTYTSGRGTVSQENDFMMITPFLTSIESIKIQGQQYVVKG